MSLIITNQSHQTPFLISLNLVYLKPFLFVPNMYINTKSLSVCYMGVRFCITEKNSTIVNIDEFVLWKERIY